jgi:Tol biopolymer transport system component
MSRARRMGGILVLVLVICVSCSLLGNVPEAYWETSPIWSPDGKYIAFGCYYSRGVYDDVYPQDGYEICVAQADGTEYRRLTANDRKDAQPAWSPDGKQIAFVSSGFEGKVFSDTIMLINPDGSGLVKVVDGQGPPAWSPDGKYIAYSNAGGNVAIVDLDNGKSISLSTSGDGSYDFRPVWSPDGKHIAFESSRDGHDEIYVITIDGTGQTRLTNDLLQKSRPVWSPDGERIAFLSFHETGTGKGYSAVEVVNPDGSHRQQLTYQDTGIIGWALDGQSIVLIDAGKVFKLNLKDGAEEPLLDVPWDAALNISPDGRLIATVRHDLGAQYTERIWIMNWDKSREFKLTPK